MKRRMLALLLALVLTLSIIPAAFAEDAPAPAGEAQTTAEEKREEAEQPESEDPEEEEEEKAAEEPAVFAAPDADEEEEEEPENLVTAYLLGVELQNGYYLTTQDANGKDTTDLDMETYTETEPTDRTNYLSYQDGVLTVYGSVRCLKYGGSEDGGSVLQVTDGKLVVKGGGALSLQGYGVPALDIVTENGASVEFAFDGFTGIGDQLYICSSKANAVTGDLTISSAKRVWIEAFDIVGDTVCGTILGNAQITADHVSLRNTAGGSCVLGNLTAEADYLDVINESVTFPALQGTVDVPGVYQITTDRLNMQNPLGPALEGNLSVKAKTKDEKASFWISGCVSKVTPDVAGELALVSGNITANGGELSLSNQKDDDDADKYGIGRQTASS